MRMYYDARYAADGMNKLDYRALLYGSGDALLEMPGYEDGKELGIYRSIMTDNKSKWAKIA